MRRIKNEPKKLVKINDIGFWSIPKKAELLRIGFIIAVDDAPHALADGSSRAWLECSRARGQIGRGPEHDLSVRSGA